MKLLPILNGKKHLGLVGFVLIVVFLVVAPVWAAEGRGGGDVVIGSDEVIDDDLYISGNTVTINGTVKGDVIATGSLITINGIVDGDVIAAGQAIIINGTVGQHIRMAGQVLVLGENAQVANSITAAGFSLETQPGSIAQQDLLFAGYQALVTGNIGRDFKAATSALQLNGMVGRNVNVNVGGSGGSAAYTRFMAQSPVAMPVVLPGLHVADASRVGGTFTYQTPPENSLNPAAHIVGKVVREEPQIRPTQTPSAGAALVSALLNQVQRYITLLLIGVLLLWIVPSWTRHLGDTVQQKPLPSLVYGIIAFLLFVFGVLLIFGVTLFLALIFGLIRLGNLLPAILGVGFLADAALVIGYFIFTAYVPQVALSFLGGRWLLTRLQPAWTESRFWPLCIGLILFVILTVIPILGGIIGIVVTLLGLGALWLWVQILLSNRPNAPAMAAGIESGV